MKPMLDSGYWILDFALDSDGLFFIKYRGSGIKHREQG
jgi:hypothetical protein